MSATASSAGETDFTKRALWGTTSTPSAYANDPKFKKYTQQVEKCLSSFDSVHEWADFISFLKQLLKTFQSYMQFKEIPRKVIVAKRLSQCLNPALPTGVHQRSLDVYAHIFAVLGSEGLQRDLALWSSGLFPFFEYAATSVKPTLLNLLDTHYLPLQSSLRPVMKSFILALLPGLEEETGEFFERVMGLLDRLSGTVSPSFFLQNIWLIMLTSPSARGTSLNFLSRRLPRLKADEDITAIVGRDIGLMIRAISAALEDDDSLVRRGALDILLQSLPVDSVAVKKASTEDRVILMRAATSVVLRRDLALNRRLYTWLLGNEEGSKAQMVYLKANALDLLTLTLKDEMFHPSSDYAPSRPFKIFISLLDKWEIGSQLTEALVVDSFKALKSSIETGTDTGEEMNMTASNLYEAVEPQSLWKELLDTALSDIVGDGAHCEGLSMVRHILHSYHTHDEEIEAIHLPVVFTALLEVLASCMEQDVNRIGHTASREALLLLSEFWKHTRLRYFKEWPRNTGQSAEESSTPNAYTFACTFYSIPERPALHCSELTPSSPLLTTFHHLRSLTMSIGKALLDLSSPTSFSWEPFVQSLILLNDITRQLEAMSEAPIIHWEPKEWLSLVLSCLNSKALTFSVVDHIVSTVVTLQDSNHLQPQFSIGDRTTMAYLTNPLLRYLRSPYASYHARAVSLIWVLDGRAVSPQIVSIISENLASATSVNAKEAYDAFGVLWRLTDDALIPGKRMKIPMMIVLDTLRSDDPNMRRIGETWMRCSLKSYLRVLDPLLHEICDPTILRRPVTLQINGKQVQSFTYQKPFDQRYITHMLGMLLSVVKFGGQGFSKIARGTSIERSTYPDLIERTKDVGGRVADATYMDVIVNVSLLYMQSEPHTHLAATMGPHNEALQSAAVDLLQAVIARGEVDVITLQAAESIIIGKLYSCVHAGRLNLQNKLLHLLHSSISAFRSHNDIHAQKSARVDERTSESTRSREPTATAFYLVNPLLVQTLNDGISVPSNRAILQHWLDFVMMTVPQFHDMLQPAISPLNDCVCRQLRTALAEITSASQQESIVQDVTAFTTDSDFIMLLNTVERLVLLSLSHVPPSQLDDDVLSEKPNQESSGLLGYMSNVFSTDAGPVSAEDQPVVKFMDCRCLHEGIRVLFAIWDQMANQHHPDWNSKEESLTMIYSRTRTRCRRVLEHLFRAHPLEVLESIVDCWSRGTSQVPAAFELVDVLTASALNVVGMLCESIAVRIPGVSDRPRRHSLCPSLTDLTLFDFLEQYMCRLEGPVAVQVWGRFYQLTRDLTTTLKEFKPQVFSALRCFTALAEKLTQTTIVEEKRIRKELQDMFSKLIDICLLAGRSYESASWIRRGQATFGANGNGRDSPLPRGRSELKMDEKMNASSSSLPDGGKVLSSSDITDQVNTYLASEVIPNIRKFLVEGDKILSTCNGVVTTIVSPALKSRARPLDVDATILSLLREMTRISAALKAWRGPIVDILNDNRCFNSTPIAGKNWRILIKSLFETDKAALTELLSRVTTAPSANIFTNKEYEMLLRSLNLRRLAYVILSGEKNQFLTQLPTIQEKLVDTLRNVTAPVVQSEVYLCVRILLCRLSPHNLSSFWPVILTELFRVFEQVLVSLPSDGSEELALILAAAKLLDLLLVLETEEFQIHQWIFITDTVDAIYKPDHWQPAALLDRLAEVVGELPSEGETGKHNQHGTLETPMVKLMRRPLLQTMHSMDSIRDLASFFSQASITSYESVYNSGGNVDWEAVEDGLFQDMFDGR